jgi:twitching motility two-component system response regulator PilG
MNYMNSKGILSVAVIGFPTHDQGILRRIFILTSSRNRSYTLVPISANQSPDIILVDGDERDAIATWRRLCAGDKAIAAVPVVIVTKSESLPSDQHHHLQRPLLAPRVLHTLDQVDITAGAMSSAASLQHHRALVIDDSLAVRKQVELELKRLDIEADVAESGEQALEFLRNDNSYDIVFLDVILPGVDGYTLCKIIKRDRRRKQIPVIMLTGKGSPFDRVRGKLAGCKAYLTKPVAREEFQAVVKKYLSQPHRDEVAIF